MYLHSLHHHRHHHHPLVLMMSKIINPYNHNFMFLRAGGSKKLKNDSLGTVLVIVLVCPRPINKMMCY